jgi:hypothetical protein
MEMEDFNVFVERENDESVLKSQANQMLSVFLERQMIDDITFANLFNRSTPNDVTRAMRAQSKIRNEAKIQAERANQEAMMQQQQQAIESQEKQELNLMAQMQDSKDLEMRRQDIDMDKALLKSLPNG